MNHLGLWDVLLWLAYLKVFLNWICQKFCILSFTGWFNFSETYKYGHKICFDSNPTIHSVLVRISGIKPRSLCSYFGSFRYKEAWKTNLSWLQHMKASTTIPILLNLRQHQARLTAWPLVRTPAQPLSACLDQPWLLAWQKPSPVVLIQSNQNPELIRRKSDNSWWNRWHLPWPKIPILQQHLPRQFQEEFYPRIQRKNGEFQHRKWIPSVLFFVNLFWGLGCLCKYNVG